MMVITFRASISSDSRKSFALPPNLHYSRVSEFLIVDVSPSVCDVTHDGGVRADAA